MLKLSKNQTVHNAGKRKTAIAKATIKPGKGIVRVNHMLIDLIQPRIYQLKILEPVIIAGDIAKKIDIDVTVNGGGMNSQAEAARLAIGRALADHTPKLRQALSDYDRQLLVADVRYKETHKPNTHGSARSKKQKSYR